MRTSLDEVLLMRRGGLTDIMHGELGNGTLKGMSMSSRRKETT